MKVLYITNLPSPYKVLFFEELGKLCELTVLFERDTANDRNIMWYNNTDEHYTAVFLHGIKIGNENSFTLKAIDYIQDGIYDTIVLGGYSTYTEMITISYLKKNNIPFILSTDGGFIKKDNVIKKSIKKHYISSASKWLTTGKKATEYFLYYGAEKEKCFTYPFTSIMKEDIITEPISASEKIKIREELGVKEDKILLSVGQFIHRKGYDVLLKAMNNVDNSVGLYIVGGKPTQEYIALRKNNKRIHFVDFKSKDALAKYYKAADIFILPTREDIWGLVVNEAMSYGLPVITTDRCNAGIELIDSNCGMLVSDVENPDLYSKIINDINKGIIKFENKEILKKINDYSIENMAKTIYEIIKEKKQNELNIP